LPINGRIPTEARILTTTRGYPGRNPMLSVTTAKLVKVGAIATMIDRLHPVRPGVINCPNIAAAPTVAFTFRGEGPRQVVARASTLATGPHGPCPGITFTVWGHTKRPLSAQPAFLRRAGRVLGVTLLTK
jgi:hypothetical protein